METRSALPEKNWELELNLNDISRYEFFRHIETFPHYEKMVRDLLERRDIFLFKEDLKKKYFTDELEEIQKINPLVFSANVYTPNAQGVLSEKFYNLAQDYCVRKVDPYYDHFFALKLYQLDLLEVDLFLSYHLVQYYSNDHNQFTHFLRLCLRKHGSQRQTTALVETVKDWMELKQQQVQQAHSPIDSPLVVRKGVLKREPDDHRTFLNQQQTVLFFSYLQGKRLFLQDEYLTAKQIGQALEMLTGYSANTLRITYGKANASKSKENLEKIRALLAELQHTVREELQGLK